MKKIVAAVVLCLLAATASANYVIPFQQEETAVEVEEHAKLALELINWIVANSEFKYNGEALPNIKRVSAEEMQILFYGAETYAEYAELKNTTLLVVEATYIHDSNTIYFYEEADITDMNDSMHVLLHELVHYLQDLDGQFEGIECFGNLEGIAYRLQKEWILETGSISPIPDGFTVLMAQTCSDGYNQ